MSYEDIIYNKDLIPTLEKFFKSKKSVQTNSFLKKMHIPRKSIKDEQLKKKYYLKSNLQKKYFLELLKLEENYKKNLYGIK